MKSKLKFLGGFILFVIFILLATSHMMAISFNSPAAVAEDFFGPLNVPYQIHKFSHEGQSIRYVETGLQERGAPLILFIHGAPGSWEAFKGFLADYDLTKRARLISMDRAGYGESDRGEAETDISVHVEAASALLKRYQPSSSYVVGHSYGGPIAGSLAAQHPELIDGVLMIAPLNDPESEPVRWYAHLCNVGLVKYLLPDFINVATEEKMSHSVALHKIVQDWEHIEVPVIHYHGAKDNLAPPEPNIQFSKKHISANHLKVVTAAEDNHFVIWNKAGKMKRLLLELMDASQ